MILTFHKSRTLPISDLLRSPAQIKLSAAIPIFCTIIVEGQETILHIEQFFIGTTPTVINHIFQPRSAENPWTTLTLSAESEKPADKAPYEVLLEIQAQKN